MADWIKVGVNIRPNDGSEYRGVILDVDPSTDTVKHQSVKGGQVYEKSLANFHIRYAPVGEPAAMCVCGHVESDHESIEYRGDKSRACMACRRVVGQGVRNPCQDYRPAAMPPEMPDPSFVASCEGCPYPDTCSWFGRCTFRRRTDRKGI